MENELSCVVDALPGLVWTALPDGRIDFLNGQWCDYTGVGVEHARGQGWQTAIHPDDLPALLERWPSSLAAGDSPDLEARLRRFDGEYRWFLFRTRPLADAAGRLVKWCGMITDIDDRRRAEDDLRARERHARATVDQVPALIALMTPAGEVESVNRHVLEYLGATLEELRGWATADTVHPDDRPAVIAAWTRSVQTGEPYDIEHRIRRADGVYRWFRVRGLPVRDADGRVIHWYVAETDVDDLKRAEALLAGERRLLEMVAGGSPMPGILDALCRFIESTATGCYCSVVLVDPSGTRLEHGAAPSLPTSFIASIIGRPVNVDSGPCAMAASLNEQVIAPDLASENRWAAYAWCPMAMAHGLQACWSTPISSTDGRVLGAFAIYYDEPRAPTPIQQRLIEQFTSIASIAVERVQSDASRRRHEALLAEAQRLSSTGSFSWHVATDVVTYSEQTYRTFEFDPSAPVTLELIAAHIHPEDMPLFREMVDRARGSGSDLDYEYRLQMPDRSVKHLHLVAHATRDHDGRLEYIGAIQDVTHRRLSDEALGKARSELAHVARFTSLGALTASIAHEVNQPLSGIITNGSTCLRMLAADPPNVDGAQETVRRTIRDAHRASDVVTRLRALFSKKEATTESVDLNEATREVIALSSSELQRGRVVLHAELADGLSPVSGDRVQLQQVILNLLLNAAEAMSGVDDRPRQLTISTVRDDGDRVRLSVEDSGVGVDPRDVERLFDAFYTTKSDGMGIGLSVSRSIIERHQGRLWAASNDGWGATFSFSVPFSAEGVRGAGGSDARHTPAPIRAEHVL